MLDWVRGGLLGIETGHVIHSAPNAVVIDVGGVKLRWARPGRWKEEDRTGGLTRENERPLPAKKAAPSLGSRGVGK